MMKWGIEDLLWLGFILVLVGLFFFISKHAGNVNDCYKRGGTVVDTAGGWVCAKLERV
jgi:hypothetical protein